MTQPKHFPIGGIIFVLITGSLAHFLYAWTGNNPIAGLFTPVNESVWEHMKLLFFPMLIYSLIYILKSRGNRLCTASSFFLGNLTGTLLIPCLYYTYFHILGKDIFALDISIFVLSILIAFGLSYKLSLSCRLKSYALLFSALIFILFVCFIIFTFHPPDLVLFDVPAES